MTDTLVLDDGEAVGVRVVGARHAGESFERARLVDVELERCDLSGCDFSESVWHRVALVDCRGTGIELGQATLRDVRVADSRFDGANLRLAKVTRARFDGTNLAAAELVGAFLETVSFDGCDLSGADLTHARCTDVDLRGARLDGLRGIGSLTGTTITADQLVGLAAGLAHAVGITIATAETGAAERAATARPPQERDEPPPHR